MKEHFENVRRAIYDKFSNLGEKIGSVISDKFKTAINSMLRMVETNLNKAISFINGAIDIMNKVPGVKLNDAPFLPYHSTYCFSVSGAVAYALSQTACINRAELFCIVFRRSCAHFKALLQSGFVHALYKVKVVLLYLKVQKITPHRDNTARGRLCYAEKSLCPSFHRDKGKSD